MTFLPGDRGVGDYVDRQWWEPPVLVMLGHLWASPAAFGNTRRAIASCDDHIWRSSFQKEDNIVGLVQLLIPCICLEYLAEMAWTEP